MADKRKYLYMKFTIVISIIILIISCALYFRNENINDTNKSKFNEILKYRTEHIGNNSKLLNVINNINLPDKLVFGGLDIKTEKTPYKIIIRFSELKDNSENNIIYKNDFAQTSFKLFSLVKNLDIVEINIDKTDGSERVFNYSRKTADKVVGGSIWEFSSSGEKYEELINIIENAYPNVIDKLVYETELEKGKEDSKHYLPGDFFIITPKVHASYYEEDRLKVFVTTDFEYYKIKGKTVTAISGGISNSAITYKEDEEKGYVVEKYERASDGADLIPSIKKYSTLPVSRKQIEGLASKITGYLSNSDEIMEMQKKNLIKYIKENDLDIAYMKEYEGAEETPIEIKTNK